MQSSMYIVYRLLLSEWNNQTNNLTSWTQIIFDRIKSVIKLASRQVRFYTGGKGGNPPQYFGLGLQHQHTGAKGALCGLQNTPKCVYGQPRTPLGEHTTLYPTRPSRLGRRHPPRTLPHSGLRRSGIAPKHFSRKAPASKKLLNKKSMRCDR